MNDIHLVTGSVLIVMSIDDWLRHRETGIRADFVAACISGVLGALNLYAWTA